MAMAKKIDTNKKLPPGLFWRGVVIYGRASVGPRTFDGSNRQQVVCLHTDDVKEAQRALEKWKAKHFAIKGERTKIKFDEAVELFQAHMERLKPGTAKTYQYHINQLSKEFADIPMIDIDRSHLAAFRRRRENDPGKRQSGKKVSSASIIRDLTCLSTIFTYLSSVGLLIDYVNPVSGFLKANKTTLKDSKPKTRYLSKAEEVLLIERLARKLVDAKPQFLHQRTMAYVAVILAIDSGIRVAEQTSLTWSNVDLANRRILISGDIAKNGKARKVPILNRSAKLLATLPRAEGFDNVFWYDERKPTAYNNFSNYFDDIVAELMSENPNFEYMSWHDLRRTCGCRLIQSGKVTIQETSLWLGHSNIAVTEKHYAFLGAEALQAASLRFDVELSLNEA